MGLDLNNDYDSAKGRLNALKTVKESSKQEKDRAKKRAQDSAENVKKDVVSTINDLKNSAKETKGKVKTEIKNQLEQLLDLFKETIPGKDDKSFNLLVSFFMMAANNTRDKLPGIIIQELISMLGCSEEQSYNSALNQPIYVNLKHIDLFKRLQYSYDDENAKYFYENFTTPSGTIPYSMNRELYHRLQENTSYLQEYGQSYKGSSGNELFDIQYVDNFVDPITNVTKYGDYYKVTLKGQPNNLTSVSDFLLDYYTSIEVINFDLISAEIMNTLFGNFDFSIGLSSDEMREQTKFEKILKRMMGICTDPTKKIDVAGTAKLSDLDFIDDAFFEVSNVELRQIEEEVNRRQKGIVQYEDCGNIDLPVNVRSINATLTEIISYNSASDKQNALQKSLIDLANDPNWKTLVPKLGLDINISGKIQTDFLLKLPMAVFKAVLTPKVMLGFMIMVQAIVNEFRAKLDTQFENLNDFLKLFRKFSINVMKKITAVFVEELFKIIKKNILLLVETILMEIITEAKNKQLSMYASIIYILLILGEAFVDYQNCKSVIDEILKLLNLGLTKLNLGLPLFILQGAQFLGGVSDTRAFANTVENLQKNGLPTGDAPDGGSNLMNMAFKAMIGGMNKEQAQNGKTEITIPPLQVFVPPLGAGPGTTKPAKGYGKSY